MICSLGNLDDSSNVKSVCANEGKKFFYYPNTQLFLKLMATVYVTSCECEHSIRLLKLVKTPLHCTMRQDRLNGLALMCCYHDIKWSEKNLWMNFLYTILDACCCSSEQLHICTANTHWIMWLQIKSFSVKVIFFWHGFSCYSSELLKII